MINQEKINELHELKRNMLDEYSDKYIFKECKGVSNKALVSMLKELDTFDFFDCLMLKPKALFTVFNFSICDTRIIYLSRLSSVSVYL